MGPLLSVSGIMHWCRWQGFYLERPADRMLLLNLPVPMSCRADELLYAHVSLHGWFESNELFAVHSLASVES